MTLKINCFFNRLTKQSSISSIDELLEVLSTKETNWAKKLYFRADKMTLYETITKKLQYHNEIPLEIEFKIKIRRFNISRVFLTTWYFKFKNCHQIDNLRV